MEKTTIDETENVSQVMNESPVWNKVVFMLERFFPDKYELFGISKLTQLGIASELGISRAHATITLNRLEEKGYVEKQLCRVPGRSRKVNCYFLTPSGRIALEKLGGAR